MMLSSKEDKERERQDKIRKRKEEQQKKNGGMRNSGTNRFGDYDSSKGNNICNTFLLTD